MEKPQVTVVAFSLCGLTVVSLWFDRVFCVEKPWSNHKKTTVITCFLTVTGWNSDPNASGSGTWPKEEIEQSTDLRVDGIPNVTTKRNFKRRLTQGQHSQ